MMHTDIAIIGMAGRFPGAPDVQALWQNLCDGKEAVRFITAEEILSAGVDPETCRNPNFVKAAAFLDGVEWFDAPFFGISAREAEIMDPQQRVFLECAWEALESAGYATNSGTRSIGVYGGATMNTYLICNLLQNPEAIRSLSLPQLNLGNSPDFLATRVSYKLNLTGPSQTVQSACSTSLVAVHHACQGILRGECQMAIAGGVSVNLKFRYGYDYLEGGMVSPDGHCRPFDQNAQGTIFGSGVGIVVLKKLEEALRDGDFIHAVVKGSAINNDGSLKVGYTAPSIQGQASVIIEALASAGVQPDTIQYVEAHGTGTPIGDPIEVQALTSAFRTASAGKAFCAIGSIKSNLGHLDAAAGITGLIKTALALEHRLIPATLHFHKPNPAMELEESPFYINTELREWKSPTGPRRAGVSSFGVGGTNAHVVLEEAPSRMRTEKRGPGWELLLLSARSESALEQMTRNLGQHLSRHGREEELADVAYTLQVGRKQFAYRRFVLCRNLQQGVEALLGGDGDKARGCSHIQREERENRPVVFLFPGQGSQYAGMGKELYQEEKVFRQEVDRCAESVREELGLDLREVLLGGEEWSEQLQQTWLTQPALFVVEYALARQWMSWGVKPEAMLGHSVGEYVAGCMAGVFSVEEGLRLVVRRGRLM
jgi:acyl transferase domain-containing protein